MSDFKLHLGDCLDVMRTMPDNSVDSIVTDPPYGLSNQNSSDIVACLQAWLAGERYEHGKKGFMGKGWDSFPPGPDIWKEAFRVLKPGGTALVFAGTRTSDLMSIALRLAGFELRDTIEYVYGSGFPKSANISKLIDKAAGAEREVIGEYVVSRDLSRNGVKGDMAISSTPVHGTSVDITAPATPEAELWEGWGTALKPAHEPILVFQKPIDDTYAHNALTYGVAGLWIDGCRIESAEDEELGRLNHVGPYSSERTWSTSKTEGVDNRGKVTGRWPANFLHDGSPEVVELFPDTGKSAGGNSGTRGNQVYGKYGESQLGVDPGYGDEGSAARFFYCAKASRRERNTGLEGMEPRERAGINKMMGNDAGGESMRTGSGNVRNNRLENFHSTVKPLSLMRYLVRLSRTPTGGVVLDMFMGSGSTGVACMWEGRDFIGIEREPDYMPICERRIAHALIESQQEPEPKAQKKRKAKKKSAPVKPAKPAKLVAGQDRFDDLPLFGGWNV